MDGAEGFYQRLISERPAGFLIAVLRLGLAALSIPYGLGVWLRNRLFDAGWKRTYEAGAATISIGNLTLGGTGKTPAVEYVARYCRDQGHDVAILSRGYGGSGPLNDEALLLMENLPEVHHLQGADRVFLARKALRRYGNPVLILDDGFQHRRLRRNLDIVVIDATNPWGHGRLFPRGALREKPRSLRRADVVLLSRCDQVSETVLAQVRAGIEKWKPGITIAECIHAPDALIRCAGGFGKRQRFQVHDAGYLRERPVAAFCGLGNPLAFKRTLEQLGAHIIAFEAYPDHCPYGAKHMNRLQEWARQLPTESVVVTSQKDLVKLPMAALSGRPLWGLKIALQIRAGKEAFDRKIEGVLRERIDHLPSGDRRGLSISPRERRAG